MKTLDPGHRYQLDTLDGELDQTLTFVKRCDPLNPSRFPGNTNAYPGTTMQSVMRCLLERLRYLQRQVWAPENVVIMTGLRVALWCLEFRAARRHGKVYRHGLTYAERAPMCPRCLHTNCKHLHTTL